MIRRGVAVIQPGARQHYALPAVLARADLLARLYTDTVAPPWLGRLLALLPHSWRPAVAERWASRTPPNGVDLRTVTAVWRAPVHALMKRFGRLSSLVDVEARLRFVAAREDFAHAAVLYSLSNSDLELVREAKRRGLAVVHEQVSNPDGVIHFNEERRRFPGIEPLEPEELVRVGRVRDEAQWAAADLVIAPSSFVRDVLVARGVPASKISVIPYGLNEANLERTPAPIPGRILFVGRLRLGKGVHYLAEATRILHSRGVECEVRVIGPSTRGWLSHDLFRGPTYLGGIPRPRVINELLRADVFAFPTLSEGFPMAHLEALGCGVPVVTTPNCGSSITDGIEGYVVPIRDAAALADRIQRIVIDRSLRNQMSRAARALAARHSWAHYGNAVMGALARFRPDGAAR